MASPSLAAAADAAAYGGETQVLDIPDSPPPDASPYQTALPAGDTVPLDTQPLDDDDDLGGSPVLDIWGTTQVVHDYEVDENEEDYQGTDMTQVLSDEEGLPDDAVTHCDHRPGDIEGDAEAVVHSDASRTDGDDEGSTRVGDHVSSAPQLSGGSHQSNHGSVKKSFAAVRAASLRSSGLAAARNITPKIIDTVSTSSFSNGKYTGMDNCAAVDLNHMIANSPRITQDYHRDDTKSRINNATVRKLFEEVEPPGNKEPSRNSDDIIGKADPSQEPHYAFGGLSYIESQEPDDLSQANALGIVDEFLLVNNMESSQEFNGRKTDSVKSPPVFGAKGAQYLVKKVDHGSPVGKAGTFDWIDSREDERGGEFFCKIKDALFGSRDTTRKPRSQPPKARRFSSLTRASRDENGENDGANLKIHLKLKGLSCSTSRLVLGNASGNENISISETKTKKNLFKNMDESLNLKSSEQLLEATNVDRGEEGNYEVGPDTQMAAEAMEALLHSYHTNLKIDDDTHKVTEKVTENVSKGATKKTNSSKSVSRRKRSTTPDTEGVTTCSKRRKISSNSRRSTSISRKSISSSRANKSLDDKTLETNDMMENWKVEGQLNARSSVNGNGSSRSLKSEKALGTVDGNFIKDVDNGLSSLRSNVQLSVTMELIPGEYHVNTTPIARRTRHSRATNLSKEAEASSGEYGADKNGVMSTRASGAIKKEDKFVANVSAPVKARRKVSNMPSDQNAKVEKETLSHSDVHGTGGLHREEPKTGSPVKAFTGHPKRKRTSRSMPGDPSTCPGGNLNNPSVSITGVPTTNVQPFMQQQKDNFFIKSVSEIATVIRQKKRSVSGRQASKSERTISDTGELQMSGVRTRSSVNALSSKCFSAEDSTECSGRPILHGAGSTDAANNTSTVVMNQNIDAERKAKLDGSPKGKVQPSVYTTPSKTIVVASPVCMAQDSLRTSSNKGLLRSSTQLSESIYTTRSKTKAEGSPVCMAQDSLRTTCNKDFSKSAMLRELIKLGPTEVSPTLLKDSRRRKDIASVRVLFSHHLGEDTIKHQKKILARFGVQVASSMFDATHFVTDKFVRTRNMLEAMALGKPVVTHLWLESCGLASCFIDEKNYILRDVKKEKEIGFSMSVSLARACRCPLLQGRRVFITPNTKPSRELIASLVKATHGQPLKRIGRSATKDDKVPDDLVVISCEEDYTVCKPFLEKGTKVFSAELILNGIVIQKLEFERHRLFLDHVKCTRSTIWLRREDGNQFHPVIRCM